MQILFEGVRSTQISFINFIFYFILALFIMGFALSVVNDKFLKPYDKRIFIIASVIGLIFSIAIPIHKRINYSIIHTKKITFTEQQNYKVNDEITIYPELKEYKVTEIEGKIYTVELREKR